jgi:alanyl-tRNA synthetase
MSNCCIMQKDLFQDIRSNFTDFFVKRGHRSIKSSDLLPHNDPTLMFVNSGMVQFKNLFLGLEKADYTSATTVQKCIRAGGKHNDLDNVGYTARHHTFFEMLGSFSFGEYSKEQAIVNAWEYVTQCVGLDKSKLYFTVHSSDEEAYNIWKKITGFGSDKIITIDTNDNFWSMGDTGPCGPCSEIFYDHGDKIWGGVPGSPEADGDRYIEIWNSVFMQYNRSENGEMKPLPKFCVDTGAGLERVAAAASGTHDNYMTPFFQELIETSRSLLGDKNQANDAAHRVMSDHIRSVSFLIAENILPSNEGRGYVLRRIMRRAMRYSYQINSSISIMSKLAEKLIEMMSTQYPEIEKNKNNILHYIDQEESLFRKTLGSGLKILESEMANVSNKIFSGDVAFKLYDTYGFPLDLTNDILRSKDISVDEAEFNKQMQIQKDRSKKSWSGSGDAKDSDIWFEIAKNVSTSFVGYDKTKIENAKLLGFVDETNLSNGLADINKILLSIRQSPLYLIFEKTPFYPTGGGQMHDTGICTISIKDGEKFANIRCKIDSVSKMAGSVIVHRVEPSSISIEYSDNNINTLEIDFENRQNTACNHTATHILHAVLRRHLGDHVMQKGSDVRGDSFTFDFSHNSGLTSEQIMSIEIDVNRIIRGNYDVQIFDNTDKKDAEAMGAMALFGEKYGNKVRVVKIGNDFIPSVELCGGTHVKNTFEIWQFVILSETSIGSGIRRIHGLTSDNAWIEMRRKREIHDMLCNKNKISKSDLSDKLKESLLIKKDEEKDEMIFSLINENKVMSISILAGKIRKSMQVISDKINLCEIDADSNLIKDAVNIIINEDSLDIVVIGGNKEKRSIIVGSYGGKAKVVISSITQKVLGKNSGGGSDKITMSGFTSDYKIDDIKDACKGI